MEKFHGEFDELKTRVAAQRYVGEWSSDNGKRIFRSADGAILNWWASTGTLQVQGPKESRIQLEKALSESLAGSAPAGGVSGPIDRNAPSAGKSPGKDPAISSSDDDSKKVFVVYGHDATACDQLELVLRRLDLDPFVL